jgi:hypothetical protein
VRAGRLILYALPLVTVGVIAFAVFVVGAPRAFVGARVYGGPTEGASHMALRLALVRRFLGVEEPVELDDLRVVAKLADGRPVEATASSDATGTADVSLDPAGRIRGPVELTVTRGQTLLARGTVALSSGDWSSRAREHGGVVSGRAEGALTIRLTPRRGAFAVPFAEPLLIEVRSAAGPEAGARVEVEADGATTTTAVPTDSRGHTSVLLTPRDHVVTATVKATGSSGATGTWNGLVPVVVGALRASVEDRELRVESAVERDVAYFALITETERLAGGRVALSPNLRGGSVGTVPLPALPDGPLWAVVSSEPELQTLSTVGWPLRVPTGPLDAGAARARAVPDHLLLDGTHLGFAMDSARRSRARWLAIGFTLAALFLGGTLLVREGRRAARELDEHLRRAGAEARDQLAPSRWIGAVIAIACLAMGFAVILLVAMYRMG